MGGFQIADMNIVMPQEKECTSENSVCMKGLEEMGNGLFATEDIAHGTALGRYFGEVMIKEHPSIRNTDCMILEHPACHGTLTNHITPIATSRVHYAQDGW